MVRIVSPDGVSAEAPCRFTEGEGVAGVIDAPGAAPRVSAAPIPPAAPGRTVIDVIAAPLNPLDLLIASGDFHSARHDEPYVPGSECVGTVLSSERHPVGSLVYAECHASPTTPGTLATHVSVSDDDVLALPDGADPILAAAVGNSGVAAYMPLIEIAELRPGDTVLVLGVTGSVGQLAVQVARGHGAGRVVGVGRDRATLERVRGSGADAVVALTEGEEAEALATRVIDAAGTVDVVLDGLYGTPLEAALRACGPGARVVNIGNLAGAGAQVPAGLLRGKQMRLTGFAGLRTPLAAKRAALTWLWTALERGELRIDVRTFPLTELPNAWRVLAGSAHAKCIVLPGRAPNAP